MIFGVYRKLRGDILWLDQVTSWLEAELHQSSRRMLRKGQVLLVELENIDDGSYPGDNENRFDGKDDLILAWDGEIFNRDEIKSMLGSGSNLSPEILDRELFHKYLIQEGSESVREINGRFAFALFDADKGEVLLGRDHLGIETLYIYEDIEKYIFSTKLNLIAKCPGVRRELNYDTVFRYLVYGYNPAWDTFYCQIKKVRPGTLLQIGEEGIRETRFWEVPDRRIEAESEQDIITELRRLMRDSVNIRMKNDERLGIFVSGGLDSSGVACLMREQTVDPIHSFSYRTLAKSYDESGYARIVADSCNFDHHEIIFQPTDISNIRCIIDCQDEPLCSLGITVATYLLGKAAQGLTDRVFSGHGGDELFAGHPVYIADKMANLIDKVPRLVVTPFTQGFRRLPDSDKKLNLTVKLKRFSESYTYPRDLHTYRWRIYYGFDELNQLLDPKLAIDECGYGSISSDITRLYSEAAGRDLLSRSLYVDFHTEVNFHLRRMSVLRQFGLKPMFPLLDYRLVEYAVGIPPNLKIMGFSDAKYIERVTLAGIIPDQILNRKDKIGHSIPFKNWLRTEPAVKNFIQDVLSGGRLIDLGLLNAKFIRQLWDDHQSLKRNNSHRIWTLTVLELWLAKNLN